MKIYVVYNQQADEVGLIKARDMNTAEKKAERFFGKGMTLSETEVSKEEEKKAI